MTGIELLYKQGLTPEQLDIIKKGLAEQIEAGMNYRGVRTDGGKPIPKYAFLSKKQVKRIKSLKVLKCKDGRLFIVRVF